MAWNLKFILNSIKHLFLHRFHKKRENFVLKGSLIKHVLIRQKIKELICFTEKKGGNGLNWHCGTKSRLVRYPSVGKRIPHDEMAAEAFWRPRLSLNYWEKRSLSSQELLRAWQKHGLGWFFTLLRHILQSF